ncbi:hypothetical protein CYFUS_004535 [Cystobacter fuscus]|uniref:Laminin G domain-containing protein n=1 Tax=Cystobacter fuscus TaxID=43 RepID=A0A250J7E4_9BACT|nr:LamG domain-containing protein [Cystobacter fuscus]ATB39096.1 hypothetical protein CYFUS_004535 [Cystobacter fuscus]
MSIQDAVMKVGLLLLLTVGSAAQADYPILCYPGVAIKDAVSNNFAGCQYTTWGTNPCAQTPPGTSTPLYPTNSGFCVTCLNEPYRSQVLGGNWSAVSPNDFACMSCVTKPASSVGWWSFDENFDDSYSLSSNGVNLDDRIAYDMYNALPSAGKVHGAWQLDGVHDYVQVADHPSLNFGMTSFSFEGWVQLSTALTYAGSFVLVDKMAGNNPFTGYRIALTDRRLNLFLATGGLPYSWLSSAQQADLVPNDGQWHHVAVRVARASSPTGIQFYVDGGLVGTGNAAVRSGSLTNTAPLKFGSGLNGNIAQYTKIGVDEFSLYKRALDVSEIQRVYNAGRSGVCKDFERPEWWPTQG